MEHPEQDSSNYVWGFFYFNRDDKRVLLPKPDPDYGAQLNFANPRTYLALLGMAAFFGFIIFMISKNGH